MDRDLTHHWENVYSKSTVESLGWHEDNPEPSLRLIHMCKLDRKAAILNVGAGATKLVDELVGEGYENVIANDLSILALEKLQARLGGALSSQVKWIVDDLTQPRKLQELDPVDLWHDRAVLHFFTEPADQEAYFFLLKKLVRINGFVIIAAFSMSGADKCSGLPVCRYDAPMLQMKLGIGFELLEAFDHTFVTPSGALRPYIYTLFRRNSN